MTAEEINPRPSPLRDGRLWHVCGLAIFAGLLIKVLLGPIKLFPWGLPVLPPERDSKFASLNYSEDSLRLHHGRTKIVYGRRWSTSSSSSSSSSGDEGDLVQGPETVVVHPVTGQIYLLTEQGLLVTMTDLQTTQKEIDIQYNDRGKIESSILTAQVDVIKNVGPGRPLGGAFARNGKTLYIADALLGLTRISNVYDTTHSKVEIVLPSSSSSSYNNNNNIVLNFVDDVCVGPKTGKVYFTAATDIRPDLLSFGNHNSPDIMYAAKVDMTRGIPMGQVLEYDPSTDQVHVLVKDIHFANGIAVNKEETYLIFVETFQRRIWKYYLKGDQAGTLQVVVDRSQLVGYPDGVDCNGHGSNHKCYAAILSPVISLEKLLAIMPRPVEWMLRYFILMLPRHLLPAAVAYGGIIEFDPEEEEEEHDGQFASSTTAVRYIQDPRGKDIGAITGITVFDNHLYLGSLNNNFIGIYNLADVEEEEEEECSNEADACKSESLHHIISIGEFDFDE